MADKSDNPFKLWEELKRRKVVRVIIGYLASAYVLLELTSIVAEPLRLPEWTINFVLVLLLIGFVITVIISWIYDFTSEGLKKTESSKSIKGKTQNEPVKQKLRASDIINVVLVIVVIILLYPKIFEKDRIENIRDEDGRISIAVMPFENQTGDATLDYFQRGISSLLINSLGLSQELSVREDQTIFEFMAHINPVQTASISPSVAKDVAEKAKAQSYISGSYQLRQGSYYILANLVDTKSGNIIWTNRIEGDLETGYLDLADSLSNEIKNYLEIRVLEKEVDSDLHDAYPKSSEAYRYYIEGLNLIMLGDYESAIESLDNALKIDSAFTFAAFYKAFAYTFKVPQEFENMKTWTWKAYELREGLPPLYQNWLGLWYSGLLTKDLQEILRYCKLLEDDRPESRLIWFDLGVTYNDYAHDYEKAERAFQVIEEINNERGYNWEYKDYYRYYGITLNQAGKYKKAKEIFEIGLSFSEDNSWKKVMYSWLSVTGLSMGDKNVANNYLEKYVSIRREEGSSLGNIDYSLGTIYYLANLMAEAEEYCRRAVLSNPESYRANFALAKTLIEGNINIEEGIEYLNKALEKAPVQEFIYFWKAKAFYKLERYEESLVLLEKAIDKNQLYFPDANILASKVKHAIDKQNSEQ